jgi:hypothetical protein
MKEKELQQILPNATLFTGKSDFETIKAFIEAPKLDPDLVMKLKQESSEREELDMLKRVRKIIERNQECKAD